MNEQEQYEKEQKLRDEQKAFAVTKMLSTKGGRDFFWDLISITGVYRKHGSMKAEEANFINGKKYVGLSLLEEINNINPNLYLTMTKENS